jgi:hypothetical protein
VLVRGSILAGDASSGRHRAKDGPPGPPEPPTWPPARSPRRATSFVKPALLLRVGDYLQVHADRWPGVDLDVDEGFMRIEHLEVIDQPDAGGMFDNRRWQIDVLVVGVQGLPGVLLIPVGEQVTVLSFVDPRREAWDLRAVPPGPVVRFVAARPQNEGELNTATMLDARRRPDADEAHWYGGLSRSAEWKTGLREVPLSALPWPWSLSRCAMAQVVAQEREPDADDHAAHAAAFLSPAGRAVMAACDYHDVDWPRLLRISRQCRDWTDVMGHREFPTLSEREQEWLSGLLSAPITWNDGDGDVTDGQHRLCAFRAAGIDRCPVRGRYRTDLDYGTVRSAEEHAASALKAG